MTIAKAISPKQPIAVPVLGAAIALAGLAMMGGWLFEREAVVRIFPGFLMVFNTALGFAAAGLALAAGALVPAARPAVRASAGIALAGLGGLVLAQYVFGISLGIDWPGLHVWLSDLGGNRFPGRMSPATSVTFVLAGVVFVLAPRARSVVQAILVRALTIAVGAIGALAAIGHLLGLAQVLELYWLTQVSLPTAICFVALGLGLWLSWRGEPWNAARLIRRADDRIALTGALVLAASIAATGIVIFWHMQASMERVLTADLAFALKSRQVLVSRAVERGMGQTAEVAGRPNILRIYSAPSTNPEAAHHPSFLPTIAAIMVRSGFSAFAFLDADGREIARAGEFLGASTLGIPLQHRGRKAELLWDGNLVLEVRADIANAGVRLGEVRGQHRLADLKGVMTDVAGLGTTGEFALCVPRAGFLRCAPTRFQAQPFDIPIVMGGKRLPMSYALEGGTGVLKLTDYRGKGVLAAYTPLDTLGAGLVLKTDLTELYAPIREQLGWLALTLLLVSAAGGWLLRNSVRPLVRSVMRSEQQLRMALESSKLALWDWDVPAGKVYLSDQWSALLGGTPQPTETTSEALFGLVHPEDATMVGEQVGSMLKGTVSHYAVDHRVRVHSGEWKWIRSRGQVVERSRDGRAVRVTGTNVDISERKHQQLQIAHKANHDALTGLPNRSLFGDRLERSLLRSRRQTALMAVMYIDVDKFKGINDTLGHAAGDALLKEFARRLSGCVRATDTVARLGGDEFAVILEGLTRREDGLRIANDIVLVMRPQFVLEDGSASVSASVGIAFHDGTAEIPAAELINAADRALYATKAGGRNGFRAAESGQTKTAAEAAVP